MAKSEKSRVSLRVEEVLRLLIAGATLPDIKRYADQHGWKVSGRQIQRYSQRAHKRFAKLALKDRRQLLGRHLAQRNALYTKAVKDGDLKTALEILKDEAKLQGLYPGPPRKDETPEEQHRRLLGIPVQTSLSLRTRVSRLLQAQAARDTDGERLVAESTPCYLFKIPDTTFPSMVLNDLTLLNVISRLEAVGMVVNALYMAVRGDGDLEFCEKILAAFCFKYKVALDGWQLFCEQIDVDPKYLLDSNYNGMLLGMIGEHVASLCPDEDYLSEVLFGPGEKSSFVSAKDCAMALRQAYDKFVREGRP